MSRWLIWLMIIVAVVSQEMIGVSFSFNEDFNVYFDNKSCQSGTWHVIDYQTLQISSFDTHNSEGIIAMGNSCASSFAMILFPESILEMNVYLYFSSSKSGLIATVFDEWHALIVSKEYNKSSEKIAPGWNTLQIVVKTHITGYLNLQGRSQSNDIVIVDSFSHIINEPKDHFNIAKLGDSDGIDKSELFIKERLHLTQDIIDIGSGDIEIEGSGDNSEDEIAFYTTPLDLDLTPETSTGFVFRTPLAMNLTMIGYFIAIGLTTCTTV